MTSRGSRWNLCSSAAPCSGSASERPFLDSVISNGTTAEIEFWDEGETMLDVASLAMRLWNEHRESASLPNWEVVGLEIVEKDVREARVQAI